LNDGKISVQSLANDTCSSVFELRSKSIISIVKKLAKEKPEKITCESFKKAIFTADLPPVDLLIRTGGEQRISGFLLWDISYAELYFTEILFPDSVPKTFDDAIEEYKNRKRRK
jgi:undecaprenyl diphosphate synthase